ncbi:MAG: hypothetical protein PHI28_16415 [Mangrovibacterium sp.]|nr:hypothetical protein [Mangrovibacterium sp.]
MRKYQYMLSLFVLINTSLFSQNTLRWQLTQDGGIRWEVKKGESHNDHIEMSGTQLSVIIIYGVDKNGELSVQKKLIYPMLRTIPNNTHGSLTVEFNDNKKLSIRIDGAAVKEYPKSFEVKGKLVVRSSTNTGLEVTRTLFPSVDKASFIEFVSMKNMGPTSCKVQVSSSYEKVETDPAKSVYGQYIVSANIVTGLQSKDSFETTLAPNENYDFGVVYSGRKQCEQVHSFAPAFELKKREKFVNEILSNLVLETPNDTINREFAFAKIRATESIFDTKGGLMHGPGGGRYYAAIWANDQAEYASPFFPFLGNLNGNESAINCYRHFARFMNPEYKPIPSSIVAEGVDIWDAAGDRGDMAMIAYGASRYALATGDREIAIELWPLISWCFEYLERKKIPEGVIASDNDELEGRFYAGKVNLSTNGLAYSGYLSAACLADEMNNPVMADDYRQKAHTLRSGIETYFGANVQGFNTYKYHKDNDKLRAWICIPLVMGITERKEETIKALFSPLLWTSNGILTESGSTTFWDRSTLYAFRGLMANGATEACMPFFSYYSATRLLGEHVPYPVEAWPEGGQRHLSAESALYCRTVTEGLFGINPTGLNKFTMTPLLPKGWNQMKLTSIKAFDRTFDIEVSRKRKGEIVKVKTDKGAITKRWDGKGAMEIILPK